MIMSQSDMYMPRFQYLHIIYILIFIADNIVDIFDIISMVNLRSFQIYFG